MERLSPMEVRVKLLVEMFFANKITGDKFKEELAKAEARFRSKKQRILPKARGRTYS
jgi:hypothetical protein